MSSVGGEIEEPGIAGGLKEKGRRKHTTRLVLQMNWPLADLPTLTCHQVERGPRAETSIWGNCPELNPAVASFLQGSPETSDDEGKKMPPEPAILDFAEWVPWKVERCDTPSWWMELSTVPGEDNTRKLARQVRASFGLPQWLQELDAGRATLQAPPAPPCLHWQSFMLLADSIFASHDIREVPREKVVANARALQ